MKIKIGCGGQHVAVQRQSSSALHDSILVDAFGPDGMAEAVSNEAFFDACRHLLTSNGILVINLWGTDKPLFQKVSWNMGRVFDWRTIFLPVRGRGNVIGFAFGEQYGKASYKTLLGKAVELEERYHLEFPVFLQDFRRNNPRLLSRVFRP